jgi:hypothetical protein
MGRIALIFLVSLLSLGVSRCDEPKSDGAEDTAAGAGGSDSDVVSDESSKDKDEEQGAGGTAGSNGAPLPAGSNPGGTGGAGAGSEDGKDSVTCGDSKCEPGVPCCNESCGICGESCTKQLCVPDDQDDPPRCAGFAGVPCNGAAECVDDPSDDCDPKNGGADCGGLCECNVEGLCAEGHHWNSSPEVCDCVPDAADGVACGNNTCAKGEVCCNESCGICTEPDGFCTEQLCDDSDPGDKKYGPVCGGIAGFGCPGAGDCVDDPRDDCDPQNGGADCGGVCECPPDAGATALCDFDSSPEVCGFSGGDGAPCGNATCPKDQVCCNASCGICTPPDGACIQIACLPAR